MFWKLVLVGLVASAALAQGSPSKVHREEKLTATKSERHLSSPIEYQRKQQQALPIEQQRELSKTRIEEEQKREEFSQQREEISQLNEEPAALSQQKEELPLSQQKEELPTRQLHYEAKGQIREEAPIKELPRQEEERKSISKTSEPAIKLEQQKLEETETKGGFKEPQRFEQQQQQQLQLQQVELSRDYEQHRLEEQQAPLVQQQQEFEEQRALGGLKTAAQAPIAETEPYAFDYSVEGSSRRESGDTKGVVRGQYTLNGPDGSRRIVDYIADRDGFRASVNTNEFGTESRAPASVNLRSSQPAAEDITLRLEGKTREFLRAPAVKGQAPVEAVPAKPENWQVKGAAYSERATAVQTHLETGPLEEAPRAELSRAGVKGFEQAPIAAPAAPTKGEAPRLEQIELAPPAKGEELKASEQQSLLRSEPIQSAELRKPKALDLYPTRVTAHQRPAIPLPPRSQVLHRHHPQVSGTRHYAVNPHHVYAAPAPVRGVYRDVPLTRHHQQVRPVAPSRVLHHAQSPPRLSSYSNIASEEDAPIGFEASSS